MRIPREEALERIEALAEGLVGEFVGGELLVSPRPGAPHGHAATALAIELGGPFQRGRGGPGGWWFHVEPELHLGEDVLIPDLAAWRVERLPVVPRAAAFVTAPDWVCEVLSSRTAALDRSRKLPAYARAGVAHAWLVDPSIRTLEVYRRVDEGWLLDGSHAGAAVVRAAPFGAVVLDLGALWIPSGEEP